MHSENSLSFFAGGNHSPAKSDTIGLYFGKMGRLRKAITPYRVRLWVELATRCLSSSIKYTTY